MNHNSRAYNSVWQMRGDARMQDAGGTVAVLLERTEERGAVPSRYALQDRQMQFQYAFPGRKHPAE